MSHFTPMAAIAGGLLLGAASSLLFVANGRILGVSDIIGRIPTIAASDRAWRLVFLAGMLTGGLVLLLVNRDALAFASEQAVAPSVLAGVLVGVGTRLGNGCTSGHGLCGIARLSKRSIVATAVFMATGALTVFVVRHVLHLGERVVKRLAVAYVCGLLFAVGLGISGMTHPSKVLAFLDFAGDWDPSLALVMGSGLLVNFVFFRRAAHRGAPVLASRFSLPPKAVIDAPLVGGAALFGVGWGIGGFCPGPAIVSVVTGATPVVAFVVAMLFTMGVYDAVDGRSVARRLEPEA